MKALDRKLQTILLSTGKMTMLKTSKYIGLLLISASLISTISYANNPGTSLTIDPEIKQAIFTSPELAVKAFTKAVSERNEEKIGKILGLSATELLPLKKIKTQVIDKYLSDYAETHSIKEDSQGQSMLSIGKDNWTLPIPIIKGAKGWYFDTEAGKNRIRIRRIGRNELAVMQVVLAYFDAQMEYASKDRNKNGKREYAQGFISTDNLHDGLYWKTAASETPSPLGSIFANDNPERAYHGYYYRILKAEGDAASGDSKNYLVDGSMTAGFALIAWPAVYGKSGVMSFIINHIGIVFQKNLGQDTAKIASTMQSFYPASGWIPVQKAQDPQATRQKQK